MAGLATGRGQNDMSAIKDGEGFDRLLRTSIAVAMGGSVRNGRVLGGIDDWFGRPYALPETMDEPAFKAVVARELKAAGDKGPINPDGTPANIYRAVPVAVGGGIYEWRDLRGNPIRAKGGGNFRVKVGP
jgi:hypothetical protein